MSSKRRRWAVLVVALLLQPALILGLARFSSARQIFIICGEGTSGFSGYSGAGGESCDPGPDASSTCNQEEPNFASDYPSGSLRTAARGTRNELTVAGRDINISCSKTVTCSQSGSVDAAGMIGSTAHIRLGGGTLDWVEAGWVAFRHSNGTRSYCWFTEWGIDNNYHAIDIGSLPSWAGLGDTARWRVTHGSGNSWSMYIDCLSSCGGTSYLSLGSYTTNNDRGSPMGETFRRGGVRTGMADDQNYLDYKDGSGNWTSWSNSQCYVRQASNWTPKHIFSDEFYEAHQVLTC